MRRQALAYRLQVVSARTARPSSGYALPPRSNRSLPGGRAAPLLPLPGAGVDVILRIGLVLEDDGDPVQARQALRSRLVEKRPPEARSAFLLELPAPHTGPLGGLSSGGDEHTLAFAIEEPV